MATTAIWDVRGWLGQVVHYVENPGKTYAAMFSEQDMQGLRDVMNYALQDYKTEKQFYVTGIHCRPETARQEMLLVKKQFQKEGGIVAFHGYQSFAPGEVTPQIAHEIGVKLAKQLWGDRFQVLVATHLDKAHIHNHFVLNSVSFVDGKKYNDCKQTYALLRDTSDRLCREYRLSVIENPARSKRRSYDAWQAEHDGKPTWWSIVRADVDKAIVRSMTLQSFYRNLKSFGYEVKYGKYVAIRPQGKERFIRLKTLGENYTVAAITERIMRQRSRETLPRIQQPTRKHAKVHGDFRLSKITFKGLRALYFHYLHLLRKAQCQPPYQIPFVLKEDLRKLDEFSRQTVLLMKHKIETPEQLAAFIVSRESEIDRLCKERNRINNRLQRVISDKAEELRGQRNALTNQITEMRKQLRTANGVVQRGEEVRKKMEVARGSKEHSVVKNKVRERER